MERGNIHPRENARLSLARLLKDPEAMELISEQIEENSLLDLDEGTLLDLFENLHYYALNELPLPEGMLVEDPVKNQEKKPQVTELEIAKRLVLLKKSLVLNPVDGLDQLIKAITEQFKETGYKMPVNRENEVNNAIHIGVSDREFANSFTLNIEDDEYAVVIKNDGHRIVVLNICPTGQRVPVAF